MKALAGILMSVMLIVCSLSFAGMSMVGVGFVEIDFENRLAKGHLTTARFSDNSDEFIGCAVSHRVVEGGLDSWAFCQAQTSSGDYMFCFTENDKLIDKIADLNHHSYLFFWWDESEVCTRVRFSTQSFQIPSKDEMK